MPSKFQKIREANRLKTNVKLKSYKIDLMGIMYIRKLKNENTTIK